VAQAPLHGLPTPGGARLQICASEREQASPLAASRRSPRTNLERASVDGALLVIEVKSERDVPASFRYRRGNRRRFGAARLTKLAEDALLMRLTDAASNQRPSACLAVRPFRPPRAQKAGIYRAFEAADGTRTHDLLHGKQLLRSVFVLSTRIRAVANRRGSRAITGGSGNRLVSASK
jgi:hypothetical protein